MWMIRIKEEIEIETGERLYWSNTHGWVEFDSADIFTSNERITLNLPVDGKWEYIE